MLKLAIPDHLKMLSVVKTEISLEDYTKAFTKWQETTTTSPSGRHLGINNATLNLGNVTEDLCSLLNIVIRTGIAPT